MNRNVIKQAVNRFFLLVLGLSVIGLANAQTWNSNAGGYNGGYGQVYQTFGLAQATQQMQNTTQMQIQKLMMQQAMEKNRGKEAVRKAQQQSGSNSNNGKNQTVTPKVSQKSLAFFTPVPSVDNFKIIADTIGQDDEQRALFKQLFVETKKGFDAELAPRGRKNNLAAAMTFFIVATVTIYNDDPEPSEEAMENLFQALTLMYDETPGMANVPNKDKQFLHDTFVSFGGMPLAFYAQAKQTNDAETLKLARVVAGALLLEILKINPNDVRFEGNTLKFKTAQTATQTPPNNIPQSPASNYGITKYTTNFDDGWVAVPTADYVSVKRDGVEVRLFYDNKELDDARPNTARYDDYYWSKMVTPYFNVGNPEKWSSVGYDMSDLMQANAVDKQSGKRCYVALWHVGQGLQRGILVVVAPNRAAYQQMFPNSESLNKMRHYNKFGVSTQDVIGNWMGGSGNFAEYYSVYTGGYVGMSALSIANDFIFRSNGSYQHIYRSANTNTGSTQFAKLEYNGKFTVVNDWEITATNHYNGTAARFSSQIVAVRGGYLLVMYDTRSKITYTVFKKR